ncbi:CvpA family protein [Flavobacterium cellulosilyticum]|uniref:CvpA family protein n=1 Tax=Flavobacterium cellulosilyticum TaxID=2541731 RepID=A0A4R5CKS2_9FLAO|nr:CvpA family protein [Flavobacterium cellulosilyticum]TDD99789.1 CvpA family protein [Flavobacterium cellulosilyticum]
MSFLDIVFGSLLLYAAYKGLINGFFAELASLISLLLGVYVAVKFSDLATETLGRFVHWNPKTIQITAFFLTFILVVIGITLIAKALTKMASFAFLGWINKLGGAFVRVLKTVLIISVFLSLFERINYDNFFAKKETLDNSTFYRPIQKTSGFLFPTLEKWFVEMKKK